MKKKLLFRAIFIFLVIAFSSVSQLATANHFLGGEITWRCTPDGKYIFRMTLYRSCGPDATGLGFGPETLVPANLSGPLKPQPGVTAGGGIICNLISWADMSPTCTPKTGEQIINCNGRPENFVGGLPGAFARAILESAPISFEGIGAPISRYQPFTFSWTSNARISPNVNTSCGSFTLRAHMYPFIPNGTTQALPLSTCYDSAPDFTESPSALVYAGGLPVTFNNNALDTDLDSLSYDFAYPMENSFDEPCSFNPGFSVNQPLQGLVGQQPNPSTGEITFVPRSIGSYISCIKVTSWKCGQVVSEIFRDFNFNILLPTVTQASNLNPYIAKPFNNGTSTSVSIIAGEKIRIPIVVRDSATLLSNINNNPNDDTLSNQEIKVVVNGQGLGVGCPFPPCADFSGPPPGIITNAPNTPVYEMGKGYLLNKVSPYTYDQDTLWLEWQTSCENLKKLDCNGLVSSVYNFVVTAQDNFCSVPGKTVSTFTVNINPPDFVKSPPIRCITYDELSRNVSFNWAFPSGDPNTFVEYRIYRDNNGNGVYTLLYSSSNINLNSWVDNSAGASPLSRYYVRAVNLCGIDDEVFPAKPIKLKANFYRSNQARLLWNPIRKVNLPSAADSYVVSRRGPATGWTVIGTTSDTTFIDNYDLCSKVTLYKVELADTLAKTPALDICISLSTYDTITHEELKVFISKDTVCLGTPTSLMIDSVRGGILPYSLYRWVGDDGMAISNNTNGTFTFTTPGIRKFTVSVLDSKGCRIDHEDSVMVWALPDIDIKMDSTCAGGIVKFEAVVRSTPGARSYYWEGDNGNFVQNIKTPSWIFDNIGTYPISLTVVDSNGCSNTIVKDLAIGEPKVWFREDPAVCLTDNDTLHLDYQYISPKRPLVSAYWDQDGTRMWFKNDSLPVSEFRGYRNLKLIATVTDSSGCVAVTTEQEYKISPYFTLTADSVCVGSPVKFELNFHPDRDTSAFQYLWVLGPDPSDISTLRRPIYTYSTGGSKAITVSVTDMINGCTTVLNQTFEVKMPMQFDIGITPVCAGGETEFFPIVTSGTDTAWRWEIDEYPNVTPNNTLKSTDRNPKFTLPPGDGKYSVTLTMNDQESGCWTSFSKIVKVFDQPDIDFEIDSFNCGGNLTRFISKVIGNSGPYEYIWSGPAGFQSDLPNPTYVFPDGEFYYDITLSVKNANGCIVSLTKKIHVCDDARTVVLVPETFSPGGANTEINFLKVKPGNVDQFEFKLFNRWGIEVFTTNDKDFAWDGKDKSGEYVAPGAYVYIVNASGKGKKNLLVKGTIAIMR
jgi:hypothetical protein